MSDPAYPPIIYTSPAALERLVDGLGPTPPGRCSEAIAEIAALRQEAADYIDEYDRPYNEVDGGWLEEDGESLKDGESAEEYHAAHARLETYDTVLAILMGRTT
jgi:hypothetical protein